METIKLTEGALLSALQVVIGLILLPTGIGYSLYMELLLPITMTVIYLKCGAKIGGLAAFNTVILITFCFGNLVGAVYMMQALGFGFLCGWLIQRKGCFQDDLMIASLIGCIFLLVLDKFTATLVGYSLLNSAGLDDMFTVLLPNGTKEMFEVVFYMSIAVVPIAAVMMTYVGGLFLGHRMGLLRGEALQKYQIVRQFKVLFPHSYHSRKAIYKATVGMIVCFFLWPYAVEGYSKAILATCGLVLLYFVLTDLMKLMAQYLVDSGKHSGIVSLLHIGVLITLINAFRITSCLLIILGYLIDIRSSTREKQQQMLCYYLNQHIKPKQFPKLFLRRG